MGEVGVVRRCDGLDSGDDDGVPGEWRAPGDTEKVVGVRSPNRASSSLHTAKLRLTPSGPGATQNPEAAAASEPLASSWQRSTKLPRRTEPQSRSGCLRGRGLEAGRGGGPDEGAESRLESLAGLARGTGGGAWRGRLPLRDADEPEAPDDRPAAEWRRSDRKTSLS